MISMELTSNLSNEPHWFTPPGSATNTRAVDPVLDDLLAQLGNLFVPSQQQHGLGTLAARAQCRAITEQIAARLHVDCEQILSVSRVQHVAFVRQLAMYLGRKKTGASWHVLGKFFNRNHATVIHACNVIQRRMSDPVSGPAFTKLIAQLEEQISVTVPATTKAAA